MHKKTGILLLTFGTVLILSALSVFVRNQIISVNAGMASSEVIAEMQEAVPPESIPTETETAENVTIAETPTMTIDGNVYIGTLSIPVLELTLPVMQDWSYDKLDIAPCRHFGAPETHDLVIAGHNYATHFRPISKLKGGETVLFTDAAGKLYTYTVSVTEVISPDATELVQTSGYDLTLYTCTSDSARRTAVFCTESTEK